ncbi:GerW family sporulation protein [Evansella cellulosilytica]|uniref:Sporulation protein YtfJ n=1 Tax=Evansella cellulosilytica (strain ATCC 21833 / DSM 2522 / FERM P-1141 / JCM 9156 / N-4) TaxID=649639 RepID=E6U145_EVAC2|nr:GerW family sporulation protein [Evansella cellulosilytica]ADU31491.1 sporulation protein YtfJ [Evansella cellulosilytica DSM 2522]
MSDHPIQGLMKTAMENLKEMVDVNTIVGDPVETPDGSVILPISKVGFGFAAGGSEFVLEGSPKTPTETEKKHPFGGGSGGGVSITPIAFLVVNGQGVNMVHLDQNTHLYEKLLDFAPQVVDKIQQMIQSNQSSGQSQGSTGQDAQDININVDND